MLASNDLSGALRLLWQYAIVPQKRRQNSYMTTVLTQRTVSVQYTLQFYIGPYA